MSEACKNILLKSGYNSLDADSVIDNIRNSGKSLDELATILKEKQSKRDFHPQMYNRSKLLGNSYLTSMKEVSSKLKHPFKTLQRFFAGDIMGATQRSQSRWLSILSRYVSETGVSERDFFKMIEGPTWLGEKLGDDAYADFRMNLIRELTHDGEEMVTGDVIANKLANANKRQWRMDLLEANEYGAGIKYKNEWGVQQYHNQEMMAHHGQDSWVNDILENIDQADTIDNIRHFYPDTQKISDDKFDLKVFLKSAYNNMVNSTSSGQGVLSEQFSLHRIFEFKDAESLVAYNSKYGHENIAHAMLENQEMFQKYLTLGEMMGYGTVDVKGIPHPAKGQLIHTRDVFSPILETRKLFQALKDMGKLSPYEHSQLSAVFRELTGDNLIVGSPKRAAMVQNFIAWQSMSVLGKSMFSTVSDIGSAAIMLHNQGVSPGQAYYGMIRNTLRQYTGGLSPVEQKMVWNALHTATDGTLMSNAAKMSPDMKKGGMLARGANEMFHFSGLNGMTNAQRNGYAYMTSQLMANNLKKNYDDLLPQYKDFIQEGGITKGDWEALQEIGSFNAKLWNKNANKLDNFITMDHILERGQELKIPGTVKLANKVDNFFIQGSRSAIPEAKAIDRALLHGNHDRGSWFDVTRRLATVFRSYQSQLVRNLYPRIHKIGLPSVVHIVPYVGLGYLSITLKELVKGKEPPPPSTQLWIDAVVHSGLAPIVGDYIVGEYGRYSHAWDEDLGGISWSKFKGFTDLVVGLYNGDTDAADVWQSVRYNTPFANLYFTEAAVNYGLHYAMMESLRPGYLYSYEAQAASQGTDFFYEPSNLYGS